MVSQKKQHPPPKQVREKQKYPMNQLQNQLLNLYQRLQKQPKNKELKKQYQKVLLKLDELNQKEPLPF